MTLRTDPPDAGTPALTIDAGVAHRAVARRR